VASLCALKVGVDGGGEVGEGGGNVGGGHGEETQRAARLRLTYARRCRFEHRQDGTGGLLLPFSTTARCAQIPRRGAECRGISPSSDTQVVDIVGIVVLVGVSACRSYRRVSMCGRRSVVGVVCVEACSSFLCGQSSNSLNHCLSLFMYVYTYRHTKNRHTQ